MHVDICWDASSYRFEGQIGQDAFATNEMFPHYPSDIEDRQDIPGPKSQVTICSNYFEIRIPYADAVECGQFGLWAENRLLLVQASDMIRLEKLQKLPCTLLEAGMHGKGRLYIPEDNKLPAKSSLQDYFSSERLELLRYNAEKLWIANYSTEVSGETLTGEEAKDEAAKYDVEEWWADLALAEMPKFDFALGFFLCISDGENPESLQ